jgi:hypothetical protein
MQEVENFSARYSCHHLKILAPLTPGSKSAYERQLKAWGCHKNLPEVNWKFISLRLRERRAEGKNSDVYHYGNLIDKKKTENRAARVHITFEESHIARK